MQPLHRIRFGNIKVKVRQSLFGNTLIWSRKGITFVLMGELSVEEMMKIVRSMK